MFRISQRQQRDNLYSHDKANRNLSSWIVYHMTRSLSASSGHVKWFVKWQRLKSHFISLARNSKVLLCCVNASCKAIRITLHVTSLIHPLSYTSCEYTSGWGDEIEKFTGIKWNLLVQNRLNWRSQGGLCPALHIKHSRLVITQTFGKFKQISDFWLAHYVFNEF